MKKSNFQKYFFIFSVNSLSEYAALPTPLEMNPVPPSSLYQDMYRNEYFHNDPTAKKAYIRTHKYFHSMLDCITTLKKEGTIPPLEIPNPSPMDFEIEEFIESLGLDLSPASSLEDPNKQHDREQFLLKLDTIRVKYREELDKLNQISHDFMLRMINVLKDQSMLRPILETEVNSKTSHIHNR